jgi:hypothetical protein
MGLFLNTHTAKKTIELQAEDHERLIELAQDIQTQREITLDPAACHEGDILLWDRRLVQIGLDYICDRLMETVDSEDEEEIERNTGRLINIRQGILALLALQERGEGGEEPGGFHDDEKETLAVVVESTIVKEEEAGGDYTIFTWLEMIQGKEPSAPSACQTRS